MAGLKSRRPVADQDLPAEALADLVRTRTIPAELRQAEAAISGWTA